MPELAPAKAPSLEVGPGHRRIGAVLQMDVSPVFATVSDEHSVIFWGRYCANGGTPSSRLVGLPGNDRLAAVVRIGRQAAVRQQSRSGAAARFTGRVDSSLLAPRDLHVLRPDSPASATSAATALTERPRSARPRSNALIPASSRKLAAQSRTETARGQSSATGWCRED